MSASTIAMMLVLGVFPVVWFTTWVVVLEWQRRRKVRADQQSADRGSDDA